VAWDADAAVAERDEGVLAVQGAAWDADAAAERDAADAAAWVEALAVQDAAWVADGVGLGVQANPFVPFRAQIPCLPHYCRAVHSDS
jgi:hypothetical protein